MPDYATDDRVTAQSQPGYEDGEKEKLTATKVRQWFTDSYKSHVVWRDEVVDNLKMLSGDQWPDDLKQKPYDMGMAPIVINKMLMPLMFISGVQRQTRQEAKLLPFEGGDLRSTGIMNALLHWVEEQNDAEEVDSSVFLHKAAVGLAWWKVTQDFNTPELEGRLRIRRRHSLAVFPDPNWLDDGWDSAQYVIDAEWMTCEEAAARWPEFKADFKREPGEWVRSIEGDNTGGAGISEHIGDSLSSERLFWDKKTKRIRILECFYKEQQAITVAYHVPSGETKNDPEEVAALQEQVKLLPPQEQQNILFVRRPVVTVHMAHQFVDTLLDDEVSPYETSEPTFPLFPSLGFYFWAKPFGLADLMKDVQREKNKRRSKLIELVGRIPLSGFFNSTSGGADQKQLEEYAAGNGKIINFDTKEPTQIKPPDLPMALIRLEDKSDEEIKDVPNVHNELLGQATQKTISGRAIEARQRGGLVSHEHLFDSFRKEKTRVDKFVVEMIKQFMSATQALRILGSIAQRQPESPVGAMMGQAQAQDPMQLAMMDIEAALSTAFDTDYDVVISARPAEPSLAMQAWETLSEMATAGAPIPPQVLFKSAAKAGILTEDQVQEILDFIQAQQQAQMQPPPPGMAPGPAAPPPAPPA